MLPFEVIPEFETLSGEARLVLANRVFLRELPLLSRERPEAERALEDPAVFDPGEIAPDLLRASIATMAVLIEPSVELRAAAGDAAALCQPPLAYLENARLEADVKATVLDYALICKALVIANVACVPRSGDLIYDAVHFEQLPAEPDAVRAAVRDIALFNQADGRFGVLDVFSAPLWAGEVPPLYEASWARMRLALRAQERGYEPLIDWYEDRLFGAPWDEAQTLRWARSETCWGARVTPEDRIAAFAA